MKNLPCSACSLDVYLLHQKEETPERKCNFLMKNLTGLCIKNTKNVFLKISLKLFIFCLHLIELVNAVFRFPEALQQFGVLIFQ